MILCTYDDRKSAEPGVKLLVASLYRHCPDIRIILCFPPADDNFRSWVKNYRNVSLETDFRLGGLGWNVKPYLLLSMLERGYNDVIWIDTDVIITKNIMGLFSDLYNNTLVVTEEALWGHHSDDDAMRARAWGLNIGRILPFCINTGVVRVTGYHIELLKKWIAMLNDCAYQQAQMRPIFDRPPHLVGDQDVLTAILCCSQFVDVEVKILRRGFGILQIFGLKSFTLRERFYAIINGIPTFIHSQQFKPWLKQNGISALQKVYLDTSPYKLAASTYKADLNGDDAWLKARHPIGALLLRLGLGHPALCGLPIAIWVDIVFPLGKCLNAVRSKFIHK